jgi:hypothetical protein
LLLFFKKEVLAFCCLHAKAPHSAQFGPGKMERFTVVKSGLLVSFVSAAADIAAYAGRLPRRRRA